MYHLTLCLLFVLGVDAIVPHSHYTHMARRFHGHPQTLGAFPRSSYAMNVVDPPVDPSSRSSKHAHQARHLRREVANHDWARNDSLGTTPNVPERGVNYLSNTEPVPAAHPARPIPATDMSTEAVPASISPPPVSANTAPPQATKTPHDGKGQQPHHKGVPKHRAGRSKMMMKKTMRL